MPHAAQGVSFVSLQALDVRAHNIVPGRDAFVNTWFCGIRQDKELRDLRDRMQDKEGELDTLRKAGKNLRERLDEKEVETRGIMDRVSLVQVK